MVSEGESLDINPDPLGWSEYCHWDITSQTKPGLNMSTYLNINHIKEAVIYAVTNYTSF